MFSTAVRYKDMQMKLKEVLIHLFPQKRHWNDSLKSHCTVKATCMTAFRGEGMTAVLRWNQNLHGKKLSNVALMLNKLKRLLFSQQYSDMYIVLVLENLKSNLILLLNTTKETHLTNKYCIHCVIYVQYLSASLLCCIQTFHFDWE